jgi:hypothetical protein
MFAAFGNIINNDDDHSDNLLGKSEHDSEYKGED